MVTYMVWLGEKLLDQPLAQTTIATGDENDGWGHSG